MFLLDSVLIFIGFCTTLVAVIYKDTSKDNRPTVAGYLIIALAIFSGGFQYIIKKNEIDEKTRYQQLFHDVYTGWSSIGVFDPSTNTWDLPKNEENYYLLNLKSRTPEDIKKDKNAIFIIGTDLNGRKEKFDKCEDFEKWQKSDNKTTVFFKGQIVKIEEGPLSLKCPDGKLRVIAKITDTRLR